MNGQDNVPSWARLKNQTRRPADLPWDQAPIPRRWHRCRVQSSFGAADGSVVVRCRCGARRFATARIWHDRNTRRTAR